VVALFVAKQPEFGAVQFPTRQLGKKFALTLDLAEVIFLTLMSLSVALFKSNASLGSTQFAR